MGLGTKVLLVFLGTFVFMLIITWSISQSFWVALFLGSLALWCLRDDTAQGRYESGVHYHLHHHQENSRVSSSPRLQHQSLYSNGRHEEMYESEWSEDSRLYGDHHRKKVKKKKKKQRLQQRAMIPYVYRGDYEYDQDRPRHYRDLL